MTDRADPGGVGDDGRGGAARLVSELLPDTVAVAEAYDDPAALPLYPREQAVVARAVEQRRREFATVRTLARCCLARLGRPPEPLLPDADRAPVWPSGLVGSLTHCDGYRAAAAARVVDVAALGIGAEPHEALPDGLLEFVTVRSDALRWPP